MQKLAFGVVALVLWWGSTPAVAHVPKACEVDILQLTALYAERSQNLAKAEGLSSRLVDLSNRAASVAKFELAEMLGEIWTWTGNYVRHDAEIATAVSKAIGCIAR